MDAPPAWRPKTEDDAMAALALLQHETRSDDGGVPVIGKIPEDVKQMIRMAEAEKTKRGL